MAKHKKSKNRKRLKIRFEDLYKIFCSDTKLRFVCYYCGLSAPELDHVPPLSKIENLLEIGYARTDMDFFKVPSCRECNKLALDYPHLRLSERFIFVKKRLFEKYRKKLLSATWTHDELEELDFALRVYVSAHTDFVQFLNKRLFYGFSSIFEAKEALDIDLGLFEGLGVAV
jgi:hypothetical protein